MEQPAKLYQKRPTDSIPSFGLILFYKPEPDSQPVYLIQQRRDTFEYVEYFMDPKYTPDRLRDIASLLSSDEKDRILTYGMDELWGDLWVDRTAKMYKDGYPRAYKKYEHTIGALKKYLNSQPVCTNDPPWGFPKGRKNDRYESDQDCAIRETEEETRIPKKLYTILPYKYEEKFKGSNGITYSTIYFLCKVSEPYIPDIMQTPHCIRKTTLSEEVQNMIWIPYEETHKYLNMRRQLLLREVTDTINKNNL
jgi:ADP-ribose pyrophosphatase YjhB (NUDIX family)